jgi:hypothetical protein
MHNVTTFHCSSCGAVLDAEMNREYIFCKYCGSKNKIETEAMRTNINLGNINITAKTELSNLMALTEYAIELKQFDRANEMLMAAILNSGDDYRIYICRAMIGLHINPGAFFWALEKLKILESKQRNGAITNAIRELMMYRGHEGLTALHFATFYERNDLVVFCVEHGSDVNAIGGVNNDTPISIMFRSVPSFVTAVTTNDGRLFIRNKGNAKATRNYLWQHGAR